MRSDAEVRARILSIVGRWLAAGAEGPCPLHELVEPEAAPVCLECGSDADTCRHAYDDGGLIK